MSTKFQKRQALSYFISSPHTPSQFYTKLKNKNKNYKKNLNTQTVKKNANFNGTIQNMCTLQNMYARFFYHPIKISILCDRLCGWILF